MSKQIETTADEDYDVASYKVNDEEVERIRELIAKEATDGALPEAMNRCAMYVRQAFEKAFKKVTNRTFHMRQAPCAYDYDISLIKAGFRKVNIENDSEFKLGDIEIFQKTDESWFGHIQIWNGKQWVSDHIQDSKFIDEEFKNQKPPLYYRYYGNYDPKSEKFNEGEDYYVTSYKVNDEEVKRIRKEFAYEASEGRRLPPFPINMAPYFLREAFERAFKKVTNRIFHMQEAPLACWYEPSLLKAGFRKINIQNDSEIEVGDVLISQKTKKSPYGHIQVWCGEQWVSDHKQSTKYLDEDFIENTYYRYYGN